jgi:hypothetical protein
MTPAFAVMPETGAICIPKQQLFMDSAGIVVNTHVQYPSMKKTMVRIYTNNAFCFLSTQLPRNRIPGREIYKGIHLKPAGIPKTDIL